jgi:hypothetical protein
MSGLRIDFRAVLQLPAPLLAWLERLTAPDPTARPASAEAALNELDVALAPPSPAPALPRRAPSRRKKGSRWPLVVGLAVLALALLLGVLTSSERAPRDTNPSPQVSVVSAAGSATSSESIRDIPAEVKASAGLEVELRAVRFRERITSSGTTSIDIGYVLHNRGELAIERVRGRAVVKGVMTESHATLEPVSVLRVPLEPGEVRVESGMLYDVPSTAKRVSLSFETTPLAEPLPAATPREVVIAGSEKLPGEVLPKLVERRAMPMERGFGGPRMVFDFELTLNGSERLFALTLTPTCGTPKGSVKRLNDRDFTLIFETLNVRTILDGDVSTFRVICPSDASSVAWSLGKFFLSR